MVPDLFNPAGPPATLADMPGFVTAQISRLLALPFSATFHAPANAIEAAALYYEAARAEAFDGATDAERSAQFAMLAQQPWFLPALLRSGIEIERTAFWGSYHSDLKGMPINALAAACKAARLDPLRKSLPTAGELMEYAKRSDVWRDALKRAEGLRRLATAKPQRERVMATPEDWAGIRARLEALTGPVGA